MSRLLLSVRSRVLAVRHKSSAVSSNLDISPNHTSDQLSRKTIDIPFARAKVGVFFQEAPKLGNQFSEDPTLQNYLRRYMPSKVYEDVSGDLLKFGDRVAGDILELGLECERNPPTLRQYTAYGERVDEIVTCEAWKQQKKISAEEGLVAIAYERKHAEWSRLHQIAKNYLYVPSSGLYVCPLGMTDGAAKTAEITDEGFMKDALSHLTSRDPARFWTSGQWMTERRGGSDVARGTETLAVPQSDGSYKLYGYKWFTSATDSDMTMTLARVVGEDGDVVQGTKGLALFFLKVREENGRLNNMQVQRLKDKLGTRQLPTAELLLDGTRALKISEDGRGVKGISTMLNITRLHNATWSASYPRRIVNLARDFTTKRECFGKVIKNHKIHIRNLANMEIEARASALLVLDVARFLGRMDVGIETEREANVFRLLTPIMKLYTAKQAVAVTSEGLECFGGLGYLEDSGLPTMFRDSQVLPIWEGTTNILSLDVVRVLDKSKGEALKYFADEVKQRCSAAAEQSKLTESCEKVMKASDDVQEFARVSSELLDVAARDFSFSLARIYMGMLLLEAGAGKDAKDHDVLAANRWCQQDLTPFRTFWKLNSYGADVSALETELVFDGYN